MNLIKTETIYYHSSMENRERVYLTAKCNDHTRPYTRSSQLAPRGPDRCCDFTRDIGILRIDDAESKVCVNPLRILANQKRESALTTG